MFSLAGQGLTDVTTQEQSSQLESPSQTMAKGNSVFFLQRLPSKYHNCSAHWLGSIPFFNWHHLYCKALGDQEHKVVSSGTFAERNGTFTSIRDNQAIPIVVYHGTSSKTRWNLGVPHDFCTTPQRILWPVGSPTHPWKQSRTQFGYGGKTQQENIRKHKKTIQ